METRQYIFIEEIYYINAPLPQAFLNKRGAQMDALTDGVDEDGNPVVVERTPENTTIKTGVEAYSQTKTVLGKSPVVRYWFNGTDKPTVLAQDQATPLDTEGEPIEGGKVFVCVGIPNFTFNEFNALRSATIALGITDFAPVLSHEEVIKFRDTGAMPEVL